MNNKLVAALIFPLMMTSAVAYSADTIGTFSDLKDAIEGKKDNNITLGADISFSEKKNFTAAAFNLSSDETDPNLTINGEGHTLQGTMDNANSKRGNSDAFSLKSGSLTLKNITVKDFIGSSAAPNRKKCCF